MGKGSGNCNQRPSLTLDNNQDQTKKVFKVFEKNEDTINKKLTEDYDKNSNIVLKKVKEFINTDDKKTNKMITEITLLISEGYKIKDIQALYDIGLNRANIINLQSHLDKNIINVEDYDNTILSDVYTLPDIYKQVDINLKPHTNNEDPSVVMDNIKIWHWHGEEVKRELKENILNTMNPTGSLFVDYDPAERMDAKLSDNITTFAETSEVDPDTPVVIYRGIPADVKEEINAGDFITTNKQLALDYAGAGKVISMTVPAKHILDDRDEPLQDEYIYRPD